MARPTKSGLDYFPLDTDIDQDDKVVVVVAKYGMRGFGIIIRLMMEIYRNEGYFMHWTEREQHVFPMAIGEEYEFVNDVVSECLRWGFFDQEMYVEREILTSQGFQERYLLATSRRKGVGIFPAYNLVDNEKTNDDEVNADNNDAEHELMQAETQQKKRKEKKEDKPARQQKKYDEDNQYFKMASYFHGKVTEIAKEEGLSHLVIRANLQRWADDMRKLVEVDKVDKRLAFDVMNWVVTNVFWRANVLSANKFRKQFAKLVLQMRGEQKQQQQQGKQDKKHDSREREIAREIAMNRWINDGGDPDEFEWNGS